MKQLNGKTALVTGASSGIGREMAKLLARHKCSLFITARREERLQDLKAELEDAHDVTVNVLASDLSVPDSASKLADNVISNGGIDILINNAGYGPFGPFDSISADEHAMMIQVNVTSLVTLTRLFVPHLQQRDRGYILQVSSIAASQPNPYAAVYGASKAFVRNFSEALDYELKDTNVSCTCLCPGGTSTEFLAVAGIQEDKLSAIAKATFLSPEEVAHIGLKAMVKGKRVVVSGGVNKFSAFATRLMPNAVNTAMAAKFIGGGGAKSRSDK